MNWYKKAMAVPKDLSEEEKNYIQKKYLYEHDIFTFRIIKEVIRKLNNYFDFNMSIPLSVQPKKRPLYQNLGLGPLNPKLYNTQTQEQAFIQVGPRGRNRADEGSKWFNPIPKKQLIWLLAHEASHSWTPNHGETMKVSEDALIPTITKLWDETTKELNLKEENGIYKNL